MRIFFILIFLFSAFIVKAQDLAKITSKDVSIMISAKPVKLPAYGLELSWPCNALESQYIIYRRNTNNMPWAQIGSVQINGEKPGDIIKFVDAGIEKGIMYEYQVMSYLKGKINYGGDYPTDIFGFGYIVGGDAVEGFAGGTGVLLLVDTTLKSVLASEVETLKSDLVNEGWTVLIRYSPRAETFDAEKVKDTKTIIMEEFANTDKGLEAVFIIGRVPVPYSGNIVPDGHDPDHKGAWPADCYYGDMDDSKWRDIIVSNSNAGRQANKNMPQDGKFDQSNPPTSLELMVGRIDFYDMPLFSKSEAELLKQYLNRDHKFRTNAIPYVKRGIVSDNFGAYSYPESFGANGWRNLGALVGADSVCSGNLFDRMTNDNFLWSYGCGGGSYTSAGGIGTTTDFTSKKYDGIFNMLFGSYFGDWDSQNNLMRACLASEPNALTVSWAARPPWFFHHMGMGFPVGYSQRLSVNNKPDGLGQLPYMNIVVTINGQQYVYSSGINSVHIALLGDPTLTMYPSNLLPPVKNLKLIQNDIDKVKLEWELPSNPLIEGVDIYRSTKDNGQWIKVNSNPVKQASYVDGFEPIDGTMHYLIRTVALAQSNTGTFFRRGPGVSKSLVITSSEENPNLKFGIAASPNPALSYTDIALTLNEGKDVSIKIFNMNGTLIKEYSSQYLIAGSHLFEWDLMDYSGAKVPAGVYIIKACADDVITVSKLIIN